MLYRGVPNLGHPIFIGYCLIYCLISPKRKAARNFDNFRYEAHVVVLGGFLG